MGNVFAMLTPILHGLVKLAGLTQQTIEIEPGTLMNIWVPKEIVTKTDGKIVYLPPTKPAVLLLHPFNSNGIFTWFLQIFALRQEYSLYVPDFLFFGGSITNRKERSVSFQAEFVARGLEKLRVDKVTVVGISYGGIVGFKMAKLYPNLVNAMVVSCTAIDVTESISLEVHRRLGVSSWSDVLMPTTVEGLKRLAIIVSHEPLWAPDFIYRHMLEAMFGNRKERNELLEALVVPDEDANLDVNYSQTIHMLWGDDDKLFDLDLARNMKTKLGEKTTLEWIKDAGHVVSAEQPSAYNKRLKCALERVTKDQ